MLPHIITSMNSACGGTSTYCVFRSYSSSKYTFQPKTSLLNSTQHIKVAQYAASAFHSRKPNPCIVCHVNLENGKAKADERKMFIFGMGFVGHHLAAQLTQRGWKISGTCKDQAMKKLLEMKEYEVIEFNTDNIEDKTMLPDLERTICEATHIICSIPPSPGRMGDPVISRVGQLLNHAALKGTLCWAGYLSSTSVYGHWNGNWVDEESPLNAEDEVSLARIYAEYEWISWGKSVGVSTQVFRLGGIYGPGRSAIHTMLQHENVSRRQRIRELQRYTSRVHVADIIQAILASIEMPSSGRIYNVVDDDPSPRKVVFSFARRLLEKYQFIPTTIQSPTEEIHLIDDTVIPEKRVSNKRMKDELKVTLLYPSYKLGLESIWAEMTGLKC